MKLKIKERIKNVGFWTSLIGGVILILGAFGVEIGEEQVSNVINAVCSLLVVFGIVSDPTSGTGYLDGAETLETIAGTAESGTAESGTESDMAEGALENGEE